MGEQQDDSLSPWVWPGDLESVLQGGDTLFKGVRGFLRVCTFKFEKPAAKWTKIVLTASLYIYYVIICVLYIIYIILISPKSLLLGSLLGTTYTGHTLSPHP